ncbi:MAG: filamentous hemagglutinin N-terminal domain-containing protein, partial [Cyanobacteria bacterium P01_F01_bin.42]
MAEGFSIQICDWLKRVRHAAPHIGLWLSPVLCANPAIAQLIVPDATLGTERSIVSPASIDELRIGGGAQRNNALFHSFERFSIDAGQSVIFDNPIAIENIFSRVTGEVPSNINGVLGVEGPANLFFLNPNGIIFGQNAVLDMAGSFVATTAEEFVFTNNALFGVSTPEAPPLLTMTVPLGVQLGRNPQPISGSLFNIVPDPGQSISLIGGDIQLTESNLFLPGGRIGLTGLSEPGLVGLNLGATTSSELFVLPPATGRSDLSLANSLLSTKGDSGGAIVLQGKDIRIRQSELATGIELDSGGGESAGMILLDATDTLEVSQGSQVSSILQGESTGDGGDIVVRANNFDLLDSTLLTFTGQNAGAGDIDVNVNNRIFIQGTGPEFQDLDLDVSFDEDLSDFSFPQSTISLGSFSAGENPGEAGQTNLQGQQILFDDDARVGTIINGPGGGGGINVMADSLTLRQESILEQVNLSVNETDNINIDVGALTVQQGSNIVSITDDAGRSGDIRITANDILLDDRGGSRDRAPRGINTVVDFDSFGAETGSDVTIETQRLTLRGALVGTAVFGGAVEGGNVEINASDSVRLIGDEDATLDAHLGIAEISTAVREDGQGRSGNIRITTPNLILENGSSINAGAQGDGNSGDIDIITRDSLVLQGQLDGRPSQLSTQLQSFDGDFGGDITITTGELLLQDGAQISASNLGSGIGGDIDVIARNRITITGAAPAFDLDPEEVNFPFILDDLLELFPSGVFASALDEGESGNIRITTPSLIMSDRAEISVNSINGAAGNIDIFADRVRFDNSFISADAAQGDNANISLFVDDTVDLGRSSRITTNASGTATGGNIEISRPNFIFIGGDVDISAENIFGEGSGGNVTLKSNFIVAFPDEQNRLNASAFAGDGGLISIESDGFFGQQFVDRTAISESGGIDGEVVIDTPGNDPSGDLAQLPANILDTSQQIADACAVNSSGGSQFVIAGRGGLPIMPSNRPTSSYLLSRLGSDLTRQENGRISTPLLSPPLVASNGELSLSSAVSPLSLLLQNGQQAYQQAKYQESITHWTKAVVNLAQGNDPILYASTLSNLALAYSQLGDWPRAEAAISTGLRTLTPRVKKLSPDVHAQVLNAQATLLLSQGKTREAIAQWQSAIDAYQATDNLDGRVQMQLNQLQALQNLGYFRQAQSQLERITQGLEDQPATETKATALLALGNLLRSQGYFTDAQQTLRQSLTMAQSLQRPSLESSILLGLGHIDQSLGNLDDARNHYQQAAAIAPTPLQEFQAQVGEFGIISSQQPDEARLLQLITLANQLPSSRDGIYAQLHLVETLLQSETANPRAIGILARLLRQSQSLGDPIASAYVLGYQGRYAQQVQNLSEAIALTKQALQEVQTGQAPEAVYQLAWQLGRYQAQVGNRPDAIAAYQDAVGVLRQLREDLAAANSEVQFTFRDGVEPVYRELVKLLLQGDMNRPDAQVNLRQARDLIEDLQVTEVQDYFQDACVQAQPLVADQVDPNAAVIYPIVLDDRIDTIVAMGRQPLRHYSTPLESDQLETTVTQLVRSLSTPLGSMQRKNLSKLKQVHDWVIGPA